MPKLRIGKWWRRFEYKHTSLLVVFTVLFVILLDSALMTAFFEFIRNLEYVGAFLAGALFTSIFTSAASMVMLFELGQLYNPISVVLVASVGSMAGDYLILRLFEDNIANELASLINKTPGKNILRILKRRKYRTLLLLAGFGVISSPLPDELGLTLMDASKYKKVTVLLLCFVANMLGIATIVLASYYLRGEVGNQ